MTTKHDDIIEAAKELLWEKGYDATSPRAIQELSNAGQGSFYHHFKTKKDLAAKTMEAVVAERIARFERIFDHSKPVTRRIEDFLLEAREILKGCPIGRMVWDSAITEEVLRTPIQKYFRYIESRIAADLEQARNAGEIETDIPPEQIATLIIAAIQGALTLGRAMQDPAWYKQTIQGTISLIHNVIRITP